MKIKLIIAFIGNIIDTIATLILINFGFVEVNPFMGWLLQWPIFAGVAKIVVITTLLAYIYAKRGTRYINELATFAMTIYGGLGLYYILIFFSLL